MFVLLCGVGWIIQRGNFLCAGYASTRVYASKIKVKGTSVRIVLSCKLDHRTRQFLMCWLRVYAWLRVKINVKGTSVRIVMWSKLDHRTRQFLMCWLLVYAWLRANINVKGTSVRINMWCKPDHRTRQFSYVLATRLRVATRQKLRLRVPVFVLFCRVSWIIERGSFLCAGYASMRGYSSKIKLSLPVFVLICGVRWIIERGNF